MPLIHPRLALGAACAAFAAGFGSLSVLRHQAFSTGRFDLGNMVQAVWATAHGHPLRVTDLAGEQISRLGSHFDPILVAFAPLWWLWPDPSSLLVSQSAAISVGAPAVYLLARRHLISERAALCFAVAYLAYPPTQWLALNEFHPVALATPLLLWAFWFLDGDRLVPFALLALAASLTKEQIPLVVAAMGIWYALARGRRLAGAVIAITGVAVAALALGLVVPHFAPAGTSPFGHRYEAVGGSAGGIVKTALTHPLRVVEEGLERRDLTYLLELLAPLAALAFAAPLALLTALPELAASLLSATKTQTSIHFHYTAGAIPGIVVASVLGAARLARGRPARAESLALIALGGVVVSNWLLGAVPAWRYVPGGESLGSTAAHVTSHDRIAARAVALVPDNVVVSATNSLGAHLSERPRVLSFPFLFDATWVAADETQPGYADRVSPYGTAVALRRLRLDPAWRLVFEDDGVLVFTRR